MINAIFDDAVRASEAERETALRGQRTVAPALMGCPDCLTVAMIASPALGTCADCGAELEILRPDQI
jgi:hypothetical protein